MPTPTVNLTALMLVTPILVPPSYTLSVDSSVLPVTIDADINTTRIELSIYNTTYVATAFTTANGKNIFTLSIPLIPTIQEATVQILGRNYNPNGVWADLTELPVGYTFVDPNGNVQVVTTAGITGLTEPTWNASAGGTTTDGSGATQITWTNLGVLAITPTVKFTILFFQSNLAVQIGPPSGIQAFKNQTDCTLQWATPSFPGFIGVRVMLSTDPAGVNPPFVQFGGLVAGISSSVNTVIDSETSTSTDGNTTVTTTTQTTMPTNYSTVDVPSIFFGSTTEFYAMFSTVVQEPGSNIIYESQQNGPLTCGYVNLKVVSPTDFPVLQRQQDIAGRIIAQIMRQQPTLDLSPRSEIRDTIVDPVSIELSNMSVREWFARVSQSISAISQLDNASGNGISDPVNTSPQKQQIARAFGLSATDTQSLIDQQFDILGEQAGIERGGSTASVVELTFYTYIQPSAIMTIPVGATVATVPDSETPSLTFATTGSASINPSSLSSYYNEQGGWWAVTVPAQCTSPGSVGNVGAGAIRQVVANIPTGFNATNLVSAAFGLDEESNADYAAEIQDRLVTGVDSGTRNGYLVQALETPGVTNALVVAAGDEEMLRDWDPIQQKHVFGCVDIYTQGTNFSDQTANYVFSYPATSDSELQRVAVSALHHLGNSSGSRD